MNMVPWHWCMYNFNKCHVKYLSCMTKTLSHGIMISNPWWGVKIPGFVNVFKSLCGQEEFKLRLC